jgi:ribosome-binding factor A
MPRHSPRKDLQLCAQVREALYWALGSEAGDELLALMQVISVEPMPDASRLLVTLCVPEEMGLDDAAMRLGRATKAIRAQVASFINRRKAPELLFRIVRGGP